MCQSLSSATCQCDVFSRAAIIHGHSWLTCVRTRTRKTTHTEYTYTTLAARSFDTVRSITAIATSCSIQRVL